MEDQVLSILAFSYHSLSNGPIKSCFLYCSMFPSDYEILEDELVELWIGEGFLTESHDIQRARDEGYDIIESLKEACLLDSSDQSEKHVKMHDMIRDMALWLTTKPGENKKKVMVKERARMVESRDLAEWKEAHRISLWDNIGTQSLENVGQEVPFFLDLETLFLRRSSMYEIPTGFFDKMHLVRVLDLSHNYRLKSCGQLNQLVNLEYLNLSFTSIYSFWNIVQRLKKLRCLILNFTHLKEIRISNISSLQLFSMHGGHLRIPYDEQKALLKELESMKDIKEISVILDNDILVKKLLNSYKLQSCIRKLNLQRCSNMISLELSLSCVQAMVHLEMLQISSCNDLKDVKINAKDKGKQGFIPRYSMVIPKFCKLHEVHVISCSKLLNLTWLIYAPCL